MRYLHRFILISFAVTVTLVGCSFDEETDKTPSEVTASDETEEVSETTEETDSDTGETEACTSETVSCAEDERRVGCKCVNQKDRRCLTDADCRPGEECEDQGEFKVCMFEPQPARSCPGSEGCPETSDPTLKAAAASRIITPDGFETPTEEGIDDDNYMIFAPGGDPGDTWNDCGLDNLCPGDEGYPGPDKGENDNKLQGMWLAGFGIGRPAQTCPEQRVGCDAPKCCVSKWAHDHLKSQIFVLESGNTRVAFVAVDTLGWFRNDADIIKERLRENGVEIDLLIMAGTHNHEAPDTTGQWGPGRELPQKSGRSPRFMEKVYSQTVDGITSAVKDLEPATAQTAVLHPGMELPMGDSRPPYIFDDNVPVLKLTNKETNEPIGTMVSIGIHVEVLGSKNPYITSDYAHYLRKYLREGLDKVTNEDGETVKPALPGLGGVIGYFPGAVGGLISPNRSAVRTYDGQNPDNRFAIADAAGQQYAEPILKAVKNDELTKLESPELTFANKEFLSPVENQRFQLAAYRLGLFGRGLYNAAKDGSDFIPGLPKVLTEVSVVRLGALTFFTAPGEAFPESLVGGFPGKKEVQKPVVGKVNQEKICDEEGLPIEDGEGEHACIVWADQTNPPDWEKAPSSPYVYEKIPGEYPFFIGLGGDFLGYLVPRYDHEVTNYITEAEGDHYEETNGIGPESITDWKNNLDKVLKDVPRPSGLD